MRAKAAAIICLTALALGCGGGAQRKAPTPADSQEVRLLRTGAYAYRAGDYESARTYYREALRVARSVEDADGIAAARLSLAAVERAAGAPAAAYAELDALITDAPALGVSQTRLAEASLMKALILKDTGDNDSALEWAMKSLSQCAGACPSEARALVTVSLLQTGKDMTKDAADTAGRAISRSARGSADEADARRTMGDALARAGDRAGARQSYMGALSIDRAIANTGRIAMDLERIASSYAGDGMTQEAAMWFGRLLSVCEASGDSACAAAATEGMVRIQGGTK